MFSRYEPNVKAAIIFLKSLNVKVNSTTLNDQLQNHPDWPTLLCISDALTKWNIPNAAGKIDVGKIDELPTPFIATTRNREHPLAVVTELTGTSIKYFQNNYTTAVSNTREDFFKYWDGVYLIAEPTLNSGELDYATNRSKAFFSSLIPVVACLTLLIISFFLLSNNINSATFRKTGIYFQYLTLLSGTFITTLLLWYEIDKNNPLLQKVCTGIVKGNCNAILSGRQAKLFSWLSWSEVGFFFFTGGLLTLVFAGSTVINGIGIIAWISILALPYTVFSIYYQWRVAKQWCILYLAVQVLLLLGGINVVTNNFLYPLPELSLVTVAWTLMLFALPITIWYAIKPYLLRLQQAKNTKREYLRLKFNGEIFDTLLKKQKAITYSTDGLGIDLGDPAASNTLIKVCNPYCGPCAKAHTKIESLLEKNENLKVKIIFTTPNEESNHSLKATLHLMAVAEQLNNKVNIKHSLNDWYMAGTKDYEFFAAKYPMNGELLKQGGKIEAMDKWCKAMEINFTPTIFINGKQLPDAYNIEDLEYFLLE